LVPLPYRQEGSTSQPYPTARRNLFRRDGDDGGDVGRADRQ
jgi:hypothetical protein